MRALAMATVLEVKLLARDPLTLVFTLALPVAVLYVLGAVFGNTPEPRYYRGVGPMNYYVPAYVGLATASLGLVGLPVHLAAYRELGILKRFRASDVPLWSILGGQIASTVAASLAGSVVLWAAAVLSYRVALPAQPLLVCAAFLLAAVCFGAVGVLLGTLLPTARAAQGAGIILWFVMMMVSGPGAPDRGPERNASRGGRRAAAPSRRPADPGPLAGIRLELERDARRARHHGRVGGARAPPPPVSTGRDPLWHRPGRPVARQIDVMATADAAPRVDRRG